MVATVGSRGALVLSLLAAGFLLSCGTDHRVEYNFGDVESPPDEDVLPDQEIPHRHPDGAGKDGGRADKRYQIKLLEDTSKPLEVLVEDHPVIKAWVVDFDTNMPAVGFPVRYEVLASQPECDDAEACGHFLVKEALTDDEGRVYVSFAPGTTEEVLYDAQVSGDDAIPDAMQIRVRKPPMGRLVVNLEYFGPVDIHNIKIRLLHGSVSCGQFNPVNPWTEVDKEKLVGGVDAVAVFEDLRVDWTYLVFATALGPTDHLTAEGCSDAIHVIPVEDGDTPVTLELDAVTLNPAGTYDMVSRFNFTGAIPGEVGEIVDMVVNLFTDPGVVIIELVKKLVAQYIGQLATDIAFGLFEDVLADIISDWLLNNSPDFIQDLFTIGGDLIQIVHHVTLTSELKISKLSNEYYFQGVQSWQGIILYWKLGCDPAAPDYEECGAYPFSLQDLQDTDIPIDLITGQFTGMIANFDQMLIDQHVIELNYGKLILFALNEMLLPQVSEFNSIEDLLDSFIDCKAVSEGFDDAILQPLGLTKADVEKLCNQAEAQLIGPIEEIIGNLSLDSKLRLHGKCTMLDEDDDLYVDKLVNGQWWGHIEIDGDEGSEFTGEFEAEKAEPAE